MDLQSPLTLDAGTELVRHVFYSWRGVSYYDPHGKMEHSNFLATFFKQVCVISAPSI